MFIDFVTAVKKQDKRNMFEPFSGDVSSLPEAIQEFYKNSNPVDVEIRLANYLQIRFYNVGNLAAIKEEYGLAESAFLFATCNGDPIYLQDGKVYTEAHGGFSKPEMLANSFTEYLKLLMNHFQQNK